MRNDMDKVLVERHRHRRGKHRYPRSYLKNQFGWTERIREGMGGLYREKWLNENLKPLVRYLVKQVGRPWDKVYSEMAAHIRLDNVVQRHVMVHVWELVARNVVKKDGVLWDNDDRGPRPLVEGYWPTLYVCPKSGILKRYAKKKR